MGGGRVEMANMQETQVGCRVRCLRVEEARGVQSPREARASELAAFDRQLYERIH